MNVRRFGDECDERRWKKERREERGKSFSVVPSSVLLSALFILGSWSVPLTGRGSVKKKCSAGPGSIIFLWGEESYSVQKRGPERKRHRKVYSLFFVLFTFFWGLAFKKHRRRTSIDLCKRSKVKYSSFRAQQKQDIMMSL